MEILSKIVAFFAEMTPLMIVAQIFGILGTAISLLIYAGKTRKSILICKFVSDVLWFVNYILIGAYTGALLNVIAMGRETVFYNRERKKWASHRVWLYVFILLTFLSPAFEWIKGGWSWIPLLPASGSVLAVISFYSKHPPVMRYFGIGAQILWLAYGILLVNPASILACTLTILSALIGMTREWIAKRAKQKNAAASNTVNEDLAKSAAEDTAEN